MAVAGRQVENLKEVFKCYICMEKLQEARLCPHCSKLCCLSCIRKWLTEQRSQCPHCRNRLHMTDLVNCRWAEEVTDSIDRLQKDSGSSSSSSSCSSIAGDGPSNRDKCSLHQEKLSVYCWTCKDCICHHCALWGGQHAGHALKPLQDEYKARVGQVKTEVKKLRRRLCNLSNVLQGLETNVEDVRRAKEERVREIRCAVELMIARLDSSMKIKLTSLTSQKQTLSAEVEMVENLVQRVEDDLITCTTSEMVKQSAEVLRTLTAIQEPGLSAPIPVPPDFVSEIIPPYDCHMFYLQNFTELRTKAEPVYSTPLVVNGMCWRLKVYPDGNGAVRGSYLSVFLELTQGPVEAAKYEYRIDMIHRDGDPTRNIVREFASDFEVGECWGYNRFFKLEFLCSEGFMDEDMDNLVLQFQVRPPTYFQKCKDCLWYISTLESTRDLQEIEIDMLNDHYLPRPIPNVNVSGSDDERSTVHIDLIPDTIEEDANYMWTMPEGPSFHTNADSRLSSKLASFNLPGEVPTPSAIGAVSSPAAAPAAMALASASASGGGGGDIAEMAQRDRDDGTGTGNNDSEDLAALFLHDSLMGMNLDFTVPDREPPPVAASNGPLSMITIPRASLTQRNGVGRGRGRRRPENPTPGSQDGESTGRMASTMAADSTDDEHSGTASASSTGASAQSKSRSKKSLYRSLRARCSEPGSDVHQQRQEPMGNSGDGCGGISARSNDSDGVELSGGDNDTRNDARQ